MAVLEKSYTDISNENTHGYSKQAIQRLDMVTKGIQSPAHAPPSTIPFNTRQYQDDDTDDDGDATPRSTEK